MVFSVEKLNNFLAKSSLAVVGGNLRRPAPFRGPVRHPLREQANTPIRRGWELPLHAEGHLVGPQGLPKAFTKVNTSRETANTKLNLFVVYVFSFEIYNLETPRVLRPYFRFTYLYS